MEMVIRNRKKLNITPKDITICQEPIVKAPSPPPTPTPSPSPKPNDNRLPILVINLCNVSYVAPLVQLYAFASPYDKNSIMYAIYQFSVDYGGYYILTKYNALNNFTNNNLSLYTDAIKNYCGINIIKYGKAIMDSVLHESYMCVVPPPVTNMEETLVKWAIYNMCKARPSWFVDSIAKCISHDTVKAILLCDVFTDKEIKLLQKSDKYRIEDIIHIPSLNIDLYDTDFNPNMTHEASIKAVNQVQRLSKYILLTIGSTYTSSRGIRYPCMSNTIDNDVIIDYISRPLLNLKRS